METAVGVMVAVTKWDRESCDYMTRKDKRKGRGACTEKVCSYPQIVQRLIMVTGEFGES